MCVCGVVVVTFTSLFNLNRSKSSQTSYSERTRRHQPSYLPSFVHVEDQVCCRRLLPSPSWRLELLPSTDQQPVMFGTAAGADAERVTAMRCEWLLITALNGHFCPLLVGLREGTLCSSVRRSSVLEDSYRIFSLAGQHSILKATLKFPYSTDGGHS